MPTTRPRHTITETDDVAEAIRAAKARWPGESHPALLRRLIAEGSRAVSGEARAGREQRIAAIKRTAGSLSGTYPKDYLADLRGEWPD